MKAQENIVEELKELNCKILQSKPVNPFTVPEDYFKNFATLILQKIKESEAGIKEEPSSALSHFPKTMPYAVPENYFATLPGKIMNRIYEEQDEPTVEEELQSIAPALSKMDKTMPYAVPEGYFENLSQRISTNENKPATKFISLYKRKWVRYAAAAVITGVVFLSGYLIINKNNSNTGSPNVMAKITKDVKNMNPEQQDDLMDFIDAGLTGNESARIDNKTDETEIKDLLKGISEKDLQNFGKESADIQGVLLVN